MTKTPTPKQRPTSAEDIARQVVSTMDRHVSTSTIALWTDTDPRTFAAPMTLRVLPDDVEEAVALAIHSMSGTTPDTPLIPYAPSLLATGQPGGTSRSTASGGPCS